MLMRIYSNVVFTTNIEEVYYGPERTKAEKRGQEEGY